MELVPGLKKENVDYEVDSELGLNDLSTLTVWKGLSAPF